MITKGRLAVTAMMDVALCSANGPVPLTAISLRQGISASYLDQLFGKLRRNGLVESIRGPTGGYCLARDAASITVADIIAAVDGERADAEATNMLPTAQGERVGDAARDVWRLLNLQMGEFLGSISLETLVDAQRARGGPERAVATRRGISSEPVVRPIKTNAPNSVFALADALVRQSRAS